MKQPIHVFDYAGTICNAMKRGILLTTRAGEKCNTMTIGWGTLGIEWGKVVFVAYVRQSRYTRELLDETGEFTVNIPVGEIDPKILGFCGTKSGRDTDKFAVLGLTPEAPEKISVPGIRELPLTLECRVLLRSRQDESKLAPAARERYYSGGDTGNDHIAYYGEIVSAYLITE